MNTTAKKLAAYLKKEVPAAELSQDELRYELEILLGAGVQIALILIVAALTGTLIITGLILLAAVIYRRSSGGVHCKTFWNCTIVSIIIFPLLGYLASNYAIYEHFSWFFGLSLLVTLAVCWLWVPVGNPVDPIADPEVRKVMRLKSLVIIAVFHLLALLLWNRGYLPQAQGLLTGLIWQTFNLTLPGHYFISWLDRFMLNIRYIIYGKEESHV